MKPYLILVLTLTLSSASSAQAVNLWSTTPVKNENLRSELLEMSQAEAKATDEFLEGMSDAGVSLEDDDSLTTVQALIIGFHVLKENCLELQISQRLAEIVDEFGWPGESLVGKDGAKAAARLIRIAEHDREFQRKCLKLMKDAPRGEVSPKCIAFLTDALLVADGKKQRFGTAYNSDMVLEPIEDIVSLDERRKAMELPLLALQADILKQAYLNIEAETGYNLNESFSQDDSD